MQSNGLTSKQKKLVDTIVATDCSIKKASEEAGYSKGESGRVTATKALRRIMHLSDNAKSEYVQLEASKDILDRAGYKAPDKVMHSHVGNISVNIDLS